ncbi:MAG TPA: hypothetical protein VN755_12680, partial [Steroidobacteraceae bacterium]|nr:hypothetical protein [Steroidobacteraceae bacterium]
WVGVEAETTGGVPVFEVDCSYGNDRWRLLTRDDVKQFTFLRQCTSRWQAWGDNGACTGWISQAICRSTPYEKARGEQSSWHGRCNESYRGDLTEETTMSISSKRSLMTSLMSLIATALALVLALLPAMLTPAI